VERYGGRIFNLVYRMVGEEADAHDLAQDTFLSAFRALPGFRADAKFSTWLYRIAVNKSKDWLRTRGRFTQPEHDETLEEAASAALASFTTPEQVLTQKQIGVALEQAVQQLPSLYREAFVLKHLEGMNYEEMSEILGVKRDVLKMRVYKARVELCRTLRELRDA
jgi:RNA polymerase sigma-70 factor (ECF subfamily)